MNNSWHTQIIVVIISYGSHPDQIPSSKPYLSTGLYSKVGGFGVSLPSACWLCVLLSCWCSFLNPVLFQTAETGPKALVGSSSLNGKDCATSPFKTSVRCCCHANTVQDVLEKLGENKRSLK